MRNFVRVTGFCFGRCGFTFGKRLRSILIVINVSMKMKSGHRMMKEDKNFSISSCVRTEPVVS